MKSRKRIIMLLSNGFDPDPRVYNEALALVEQGYEVCVVCWNRDRGLKKPRAEDTDGIRVERVGPRSKHNLGRSQILFLVLFWIRVFFRVLFKKIHALHCHDFDTLPIGFLLAKLKKCKLVYDSHENFSEMVRPSVGGFLTTSIKIVERRMVRLVDLTITVGEILARELLDQEARNVQVVGNWKNPSDFAFDERKLGELREALEISGREKLVVLYITTLNAERKIKELMEAVQGEEDFIVIIGGKGPMEGVIRDEVKKCQNIKYLGFVNPAEIARYTAVSDVIFYGFDKDNGNAKYSAPNKLFEALAGGKAVLTGNFGEIGSIVGRFGVGLVIDDYSPSTIRNALYFFLHHPEQLRQCKQRALVLGREVYNWDKAKNVLCRSYEEILNSRS